MGTRIRLGVDTGGTFTDVVAVDERSGNMAVTKTPSTPENPSVGFMAGITKILEALNAGGDTVGTVSHGTTVATNALLQEDFSGLGFITTQGFRHVLEIARQSVPDSYGNSYFWVKPERIVPLHHVAEVPERLDALGNVVRAFDEDAARAVAHWCKGHDLRAVGVCFLHSYANPEHERRMGAILEREWPGCAVSLSSDVLPEYREYERSITTLVDAFVKPKVAAYVAELAKRIEELSAGKGDPVPFYIMKSNGGVISATEVSTQPITTILSGPAAGALGAAGVAEEAGFDRVLTLDGGGTSTDVGVVFSGRPRLSTEGTVGRWPVKVPMVDIVTVGTGGGSIAWISPEGGLKVGPRSAGADPGPLCYGRGGRDPTCTDAYLLLGHIPSHLLGGEVTLEVDAARSGFERLAERLGMGVDECAAGVLEIAAFNQANAIRRLTVKRGLDVRELAMIAGGGSGPLAACRLLDILTMHTAIVPPDPGNLSALGLLTVDVRNDYVQTHVRRSDAIDAGELRAGYGDLEARAREVLRREGFAGDRQMLTRAADLRYFGQAFEVRVSCPDGEVTESFADAVLTRFHDEHERLYGYCYRDDPSQPVEWVNLRVTGTGPIPRPPQARVEKGGDAERARSGARRALFDGEWHEVSLYDRARLGADDVVRGPAIIEEFGSTLPLLPGFSGLVDDRGNIVVTTEAR